MLFKVTQDRGPFFETQCSKELLSSIIFVKELLFWARLQFPPVAHTGSSDSASGDTAHYRMDLIYLHVLPDLFVVFGNNNGICLGVLPYLASEYFVNF